MSTIIRRAATVAHTVQRRAFSSSASARKDLVQDLYVKEIKAYKAPPIAKDAHVGVVKTYAAPAAPKAPAVPSDLASELSAYDASEPTKADAVASTPTATETSTGGASAFLSFLEEDLPKKVDHHH